MLGGEISQFEPTPRPRGISLRALLIVGLVLSAAICMILSAYYFQPQPPSYIHYRPTPGPEDYYDTQAPWLWGSGALLLLAALLIARPVWREPVRATVHLDAWRPRWRVILVAVGVGLLWLMAEANGQMIGRLHHFWHMAPSDQLGLMVAGIILIVIGLGGLPRLRLPQRDTFRELGIVLLITTCALVVRCWDLGHDVRVMVDEGHFALGTTYFWTFPDVNLLEPMPTSASFPFIFSYGQWGMVELFGRNFTGLRAFSALLGGLTIPALYLLARELFDRRIATLAALLLLALPPHIHYSRLALNNIADPLFGVLALFFLARGLRTRRRFDYAVSGALLGLTQYFYEGGRILYPALIIGWLAAGFVLWRPRPSLCGVILLVLAFLLVAMPVYYTLYGRDFPFFDRMDKTELREYYWSRDREPNDFQARIARFHHSVMLYINSPENTIFHYYLYYGGRHPMLLVYVIPAFFLGGVIALWFWRKPGALLLIGWMLGTSTGNALLVESAVTARYVVAFPAVALLLALGIDYPLQMLLTAIHHPTTTASRMKFRWFGRLPTALPILIALALAAGQISFYYGPFIKLFNVEVRAHVSNDSEDAILRAADFPLGTDVWIIGNDLLPQLDAQRLMNFIAGDKRVVVLQPADLNTSLLANLPPDRDYAFFFAPTDFQTLELLRFVFGDRPIQPATNPDIPPHQRLNLFYVSAASRFVG